MKYSEILVQNEEVKYQLLDRLRTDCSTYLSKGGRNREGLWANNCREQIEYMYFLHEHVREEPQWLTLEQICDYAKKLNVYTWTRSEFIGRKAKNGIMFAIYRKWGDERGDRYECYTYPEGEEKKEELFAHAKVCMHYMDFLMYCEAEYKRQNIKN